MTPVPVARPSAVPPDAPAVRPDPRGSDPRPLGGRVEARLAVYAQHAAVVAEQAAALAAGDVARAAALDEARVRAAEHFAELQAADAPDAADGEASSAGGSFRAALDRALAELAHQGAVDVALAQRLVALREAVLRGAAWADAAAPHATPNAGPHGTPNGAPAAGPRLALPAPAELPATAPLEGALVAARAGLAGPVGKHYPGRGSDWSAAWGAGEPVPPAAPDAPRLDLRF